jgi:hypothetical protein
MDMMLRLTEFLKLLEAQGIEWQTIHNMAGKPKRFKKIDGDWESPSQARAWMKSHDIPEPAVRTSPARLAKAVAKYPTAGKHLALQWLKDDEEQEKLEKQIARDKKRSHPTPREIWDEVETAIGNSFPDGDPIDALHPWMEKHEVTMDEVNAAVKQNVMGRGKGKKNYGMYYYLADMWDDMSRDQLHDAKNGHYGEHYDDQWFAQGNPWRSR